MKHLIVCLALVALVGRAHAAAPRSEWTEVEAGAYDDARMDDLAHRVVQGGEFRWKHAQTDHFVVHYEHGIFAAKVARMAEFFYGYISAELNSLADTTKGRSHIFIFREAKDWATFQKDYHQGGLEWSFSMVRGPVMYLQQAGDIGSSASVLGHEMTHLVLNRFLDGPVPLWLNEGLAEWYGEFAFSEFKGTKKSRRAQFSPLKDDIPVERMLSATSYPEDATSVGMFYQYAKYLVAFLQFEKGPGVLSAFVKDMADGRDVIEALSTHYGYASVEDFAKAFGKFTK